MEDPWAAGPSWSNAAKLPREINDNPRKATPPPEELNADPWGAGTTKVDSGPSWGDDRPQWDAHSGQTVPEDVRNDDRSSSFAAPSPPSKVEPDTTLRPTEFILDSPTRNPTIQPQKEEDNPDRDGYMGPGANETSLNEEITPGPSQHTNIPDEVDPEAQFLSALKITSPRPSFSAPGSPAKSPAFSDGGFGGFSSHGDPWGGGTPLPDTTGMPKWGGAEEDGATFSSPTIDRESNGDDGDGWGGGSSQHDVDVRPTNRDDDWEEAQRAMRMRADRVPDERVQKLKTEWTDVALALPGKIKLDKLSDEGEGEGDGELEQGVSTMQGEVRETLRSLSSIPSDISTYPPVINSLTTHERHLYALSRPNPVLSMSLLNISLARRSRRADALSSASPWLSRSRLGEPDAALPELAAPSLSSDDPKGRWSFWGRKATPKPLVTSGGSILEVRTPPPGETIRASGSGEMARSTSRAPSISVSSISSRPASPAPPPIVPLQVSSQPSMPDSTTMESIGHSAPSGALGTQTPQGPSAMSRIFGRLSRKHSSQPSTDLDGNDLQLSTDDFNFLQEVPGLAEGSSMGHGTGDLLSLESGRSEQIAGLESMLASKPGAPPPPLAPPPPTTFARVPSGGGRPSGRFVANMKAPAATDMDLLGGLDFDSDASASPTTSLRGDSGGTTSIWDNFLDSSPSNTTQQASQALRMSTTSPILPPPIRNQAPAPPATLAAKMPMPDLFHNTAPPPKPSTSISLDDFGDFAGFTSSPATSSSINVATPAPATKNHAKLTLDPAPPIAHSRGPSVDHSSTMSLISGASALKGRRWPAPPSPAAPNLDPPPRPSNQRQSSGGFPFLSPPPPPRPASGLGRSTNLLDDGDVTPVASKSTSPPVTVPLRQNTLSPPNAGQAQLDMVKNKPRLSAGTNLTASDLSFFDSL